MNIDADKATNCTVVTIAGEPKVLIEAAFRAIKKAGELIDMRKHKGGYPSMGATDICLLIAVANISMEETVLYAQQLAKRVEEALHLPVYLYQAAQACKQHSNLSPIRAGAYESFAKKIQLPEWKPDYGPQIFDKKRGATVMGVRDFLVAFNVNLNTTGTRRANAIAFNIREAGRNVEQNGLKIDIPGTLKAVKGIGWFIQEYGIAQISINLTNTSITHVHIAFDEMCCKANARGIRVKGS